MKSHDVARIFLSSATEDRFGLYEAIWELNGRFHDEPLGRKYEVATEALLALHRHGWIRLERAATTKGSTRFEAISDADVVEVLRNPISWYPEYNGVTVVFVATDAGAKHYMAGANT